MTRAFGRPQKHHSHPTHLEIKDMVSEMAMEDIEQMKREGLEPTPRDIIRLNALALKYERAKSKDVGMSLYQLPRVAFIDSKTWFRQPTIGHEIWFD